MDPGHPVIQSREHAAPTGTTAPEANVRPVVGVGHQRAPDPPRQGDTPSRPARMPIVTFGIHGPIMSNFFRVRTRAPSHLARTPRGMQLPTVERSNIRRPAATAYGSTHVLDPSDPYAIL